MQINKKQRNACINDMPYTIYNTRHTIFGIWYMLYGIWKCMYAFATPSRAPSFASDLFLFSFRILFYLFLSRSCLVPLGFCGSCGFQQKSIIYVMAKHWRPQTGDRKRLLEHRTVCCHSPRLFLCLLCLFCLFHCGFAFVQSTAIEKGAWQVQKDSIRIWN